MKRNNMEKGYRNIAFFFLLLLPLIGAAFFRTYFMHVPDFPKNITLYSHLHFIAVTLWIVLMLAQPFLIRAGNLAMHRRLGRLSYIIFPLFMLSFIPLVWKAANGPDPVFVFFPLADSVLLILFYTLAIVNRKKRALHMRYMIALALVFLGPTIGRIGPIYFGLSALQTQTIQYAVIMLSLSGLLYRDRLNHRNYRPYTVALAGFGAHIIVFYYLFS